MKEEKKAIIEHNTMIAELLEKLAELDNIDNEKKNKLSLVLILGMKTKDGEFVFDKVLSSGVRNDVQLRRR